MPKENNFLKTLFIYNGIFVFAGGLIGPLYAVYVQKFDSNISSISLSWAAFLLSTTFFLFILSRFGDKIKDKKILLQFGFLIRAIAWISYIFVGNIGALIIVQILLGLGEALGTPSFEALFAEHLDDNSHINEYSEWKLIVNGASGLAVIGGGFLVQKLGFNILFISMSILALITLIGFSLNTRESKKV
ncbi:MAG: MFS transporter [bacterium]